MASLAEELAKLSNPTPSLDPEDDIYEETKAKLIDKDELNESDEGVKDIRLGEKRMESLEGMGIAYRGKVVSRKTMDESIEDENCQEDESESASSSVDVNFQDTRYQSSEEDIQESENEINLEEDDEEIDSDEALGDSDEDLEIFRKKETDSEAAKAMAARNQILLWERMLEGRIQCQKMIGIANQLPEHDTLPLFRDSLMSTPLDNADKVLGSLLNKLIKLQTTLLEKNSQMSSITETNLPGKKKSYISMEEMENVVEERFVKMRKHRNKVLNFWFDKTRLASSNINASKSFSSFERSTVAQIEDILQDKERLIKRTELRRSDYRALGKRCTENKSEGQDENFKNLRNYEQEIFDDDDFYHQLLRQLIEQKATSSASDPVELTRQWLKIQRLRNKIKKSVDTKASKGRKIRYEVHQKLVSFMAPCDKSTFSQEARNQLFRSLFGKGTEAEDSKADR